MFVTEVLTASVTLAFDMYASSINAPLPWFVLVEPLLLYGKGTRTTWQRCYEWRGVRLLGGW